ncbi:tyrosine kinase family protein (macronuclear) [Tetrahymena thermophila SB210]|uniref:Tyrosine kinase family protein n=1 Tax=Tetrahymena thermophila (strain SB210) TaxID=312017 RepID=Q22YH7_TETTS|nr:tyrosine kinase family protein [Tetrahymena thermophila SB210]EAR90308.2 tyrosine kinase family protein [Tetrahymena thermophila SB210]|eukprot:XP_001010553.2 tyrosine kinase family protein [Tetrahymena thermophila SB210]
MEEDQKENTTQQEEFQAVKTILILLFSEFQPIHYGHLKMMELARQYLEEKYKDQQINIKGILIPYSKNQLYFQYLEEDVRLRMISIAIQSSEWITLNDSLVEKKAKNQKELISHITSKTKESEQVQVYQVMSLDKYQHIQKNIEAFTDQNIIFVEYRFTYEEDQSEEIKALIKSIPRFHFIKDNSFDFDIHSQVIRDTYEGGFDISLYVCPNVVKFHKSQNVKYKKNQSKESGSTKQSNIKKQPNKQKGMTKDQKNKQNEKKDTQEQTQKQQLKPQIKPINLKKFIDFDFNSIDYKKLSGFNDISIISKVEKIPEQTKDENNNNDADDQDEIQEENKQQASQKNKDFLGSGLQARVISMKYQIEELKEIEVAVKMVKFENQISRRQATFYRDLRGVWRCNGHPNIVQAYGAGNYKEIGYIVLERCAKQRFKNWLSLQSAQRLFVDFNFMQLITNLSSGCEYMSKMGILHRDLQINNILIKLKGDDQDKENFEVEEIEHLKISDFGVSAIEEDKQNIVKGSTRHYSPESIEDKANYTEKADVFSFGALLYEIFYKHWVFSDCTVSESCIKTKSGELSRFDDTIPSQIKEIIQLTWKFDPKERITFSSLTQILQQYTNSLNQQKTN